MAGLIKEVSYRPEIDGLRAIAILGVLCFHAGIKCPGGYVGVDVFFVISGYLITSLILRDLNKGTFSFIDFWERRFRRIIPALAVTVAVTLLVGGFLLLNRDYAKLGASAAFQALFAANFYFWKDTGYFAAAAEEKPLLHTWSLAVEEQFYLVVPCLLAVCFSIGFFRRQGVLAVLLGLLAAVSLVWSAYLVTRDQSSAFFLLPSRAWELLAGSILACLPRHWVPRACWVRELVSVIGLGGILVPILIYSRELVFPGLLALPPVVGTALVIWANQRLPGQGIPTRSARLLASRPFVFVGLISYSLYLWHWPVLAFINYWSFAVLSRMEKIGVLLLVTILAILSWRFVETPFRVRKICGNRRPMLVSGVVALAMLVLAGWSIHHFDGLPWRVQSIAVTDYVKECNWTFMFTHQTSYDDLRNDHLVAMGKPGPESEVSAVLWGDSHAMAAFPAFDRVFKDAGITGRAITRSSTAPLINFDVVVPNGADLNTITFNQLAFEYVKKHRVRHVVLAAYWHVYELKGKTATPLAGRLGATNFLQYYQKTLENTVAQLVESGCQPWIFLQVPEHEQSVPKAYAYCHLFGGDEKRFSARPDSWTGLAGHEPEFIEGLKRAGARIIDTRAAFLDTSGDFYRISMDGIPLYGDKHHLTAQGAEKVLVPALKGIFTEYGLENAAK